MPGCGGALLAAGSIRTRSGGPWRNYGDRATACPARRFWGWRAWMAVKHGIGVPTVVGGGCAQNVPVSPEAAAGRGRFRDCPGGKTVPRGPDKYLALP